MGTPEFGLPSEAPDEAPRNGTGTMRHLTSTIQRLDPQREQLPTGDRAARDIRAWLLRRLRWEHRLAELRAEHQRACTKQRPRRRAIRAPNRQRECQLALIAGRTATNGGFYGRLSLRALLGS